MVAVYQACPCQERQERRCQEAWALPEVMVLLVAPAIHKALVGTAHRIRLAVEIHLVVHLKAPKEEGPLCQACSHRKVPTEKVQRREAVALLERKVALLEMVDWGEGQAQLVKRVPFLFLAVVVPLDWKGVKTVPWVPSGVPS